MIAFHGVADRINPYAGGRSDRWSESVPDAARAWAAANGVENMKTVTELSPALTNITYGHATPAEVTLWTFKNAGHTWPGHPGGFLLRLLLGRTSTEVDATGEIWRFFNRMRTAATQPNA
jgi:polyhydroxybutyrate depolymerase